MEIISIYKGLNNDKKEFILSKQLLRCGTSIGANVHEALSSESKRDFIHKLSVALKESKKLHTGLIFSKTVIILLQNNLIN